MRWVFYTDLFVTPSPSANVGSQSKYLMSRILLTVQPPPTVLDFPVKQASDSWG
jgi:hypothetical protein